MILHVVQRASTASGISDVIVATDDDRIYSTVTNHGFKAVMTRSDHTSGTDRIAEVAEKIDADIIVNVQGDEPFLQADSIEKALLPFNNEPDLLMGSLKTVLRDTADLFNPNSVKVAVDQNDYALYFSRSPIPFVRDGMDLAQKKYFSSRHFVFYKHIGIYVYRKEFLLRFAAMPRGLLESAENLEQLRALEAGVRIKIPTVDQEAPCVDTPEDLARIEKILSDGGPITLMKS